MGRDEASPMSYRMYSSTTARLLLYAGSRLMDCRYRFGRNRVLCTYDTCLAINYLYRHIIHAQTGRQTDRQRDR